MARIATTPRYPMARTTTTPVTHMARTGNKVVTESETPFFRQILQEN